MQVATWGCDICGKLRSSDTNHWLIVRSDPQWIKMDKWTDDGARVGHSQHVCGQACAQQALEKWMGLSKAEGKS